MKFAYNITFVTAPENKGRFLEWLRKDAVPALFAMGGAATNPRLQTVLEAGGEKPGPEHGLSIALQGDFVSEDEARAWHDGVLPPVLGDFHAKFGPHALYFITLLEIVPL